MAEEHQDTESTEVQIKKGDKVDGHHIVMESEISDRDDPDFIKG